MKLGDLKNNEPVAFNKNPWTDIAKWIGPDKSLKLYKSLTTNEK